LREGTRDVEVAAGERAKRLLVRAVELLTPERGRRVCPALVQGIRRRDDSAASKLDPRHDEPGRAPRVDPPRPRAPQVVEGRKLYAPLSRVDWATLLRRTFDVDVTRCTGCAGRITVRAVVTAPASIDRLLAALRRARDPPVAA